MSDERMHPFVAWEEHVICPEKGNRVVHFYLKDASGDLSLAVVGTEPSVRHMLYIVPDDFLNTYGSEILINGCTKWRAWREVVKWLEWLVSLPNQPLDSLDSGINESAEALLSLKDSVNESSCPQFHLPDKMVSKTLKAQNVDMVWSGSAWICGKQLEHYPAFVRNRATIAVHSFVFFMAEDENNYIGYLEDLYKDKKGQKRAKVRLFRHNQELNGVFSQLNPHPREVFITPHVQVISAECINGLATVFTPSHYDKCLAVFPQKISSQIFMCCRQLKNNKVKTFTLYKLRGYSNQVILSHLNTALGLKDKIKCRKSKELEGEELPNAKRSKSSKDHKKLEMPGPTKCGSSYLKLKFKLSRTKNGMNVVGPKSEFPFSLKVGEEIELLCQDSGIRGCWFRCKVLKNSQKNLKVRYDDLKDADESDSLEEWVPASREAAPDKLGIRCPGRLTVRPRPLYGDNCVFTVGTPVDAWWYDGWWEGVVTGIDTSANDTLEVFFPGENKYQNFQKTDIRTSRDWVDNKWVNPNTKLDILSCISNRFNPTTKLPPILDNHGVPTHLRLEVVEEGEEQQFCDGDDDDNHG